MANVRKVVGHVAVDSGQVMIVDPCYVLPDTGLRDEIFEVNEKSTAGEFLAAGIGGTGVSAFSGFGDGSYPVVAEFIDKGKWGVRVKSLTITFIRDDDEEEDE
jgi:hypothetical protein